MSFQAHAELFRLFLQHRKEIVSRIQDLLNAQRKPVQYLQDRAGLSRLLSDCFYSLPVITAEQAQLQGQLEQAHWASGFRPRQVTELFNDLINPAEMMIRGFYCWQQTRWPGRNARVRYAHTLFALFVIRSLTFLVMRIWDEADENPSALLSQVQGLLDELGSGAATDQPVFIRDARWLPSLAQGPTTDELSPYFEVARRVADTLSNQDVVEVFRAHVHELGGHLTSQIRHYCLREGITLNDHSVILRTRTSNALDFGLLVQELVPLLEAYLDACSSGDGSDRLKLASAICQGISADPELFLNRIDLLGSYSMIQHVFITDDEGGTRYSSLGERHMRLLAQYEGLIGHVSEQLTEDCPRLKPVDGSYSPFGAIFGTPTNLIEDMALKTLQHEADNGFTLEDVFVDGGADKLAWVNGWRDLPHVDGVVRDFYKYPHDFALEVYDRVEQALARRANTDAADGSTGNLFVYTEQQEVDRAGSEAPVLPSRYLLSSDEGYDEQQLLRDRQEGYYIVSCQTPAGWIALKKDLLTEILAVGEDAIIEDLPPAAAEVLRLMCPRLVAN